MYEPLCVLVICALVPAAMENKSLNIFNTSCVCASPATATDADFERVQGIVAHECE